MREYDIYIIRDEIANEYFGQEDKIFHLFKENRYAKGRLKDVTDKQIDYIINHINTNKLHNIIINKLSKTPGFSMDHNKYFVRMPGKTSQAGLYLEEKKITLFSEGTYDAEACFFEILRFYHSYFIAMEFDEKRYGWLKPIRTLEFVHHL
ncbi:sporulation inhibitor of replication protein SirA [Evansella sp. AB-P1]|uniref:sporulation inhibitor of replication protein SirA n=1 Tax=Evansella sp. AB-P1 TaxID=3037653 RepID=UPI00241F44E2|nr:sporulation inhibitor of replication protein SirA [Evansella sp. AB-P1]MDG5789048.1 sporulation inhibitor of replication protein SirA [Evansella sp. AB-P1]